jgi:hypothetical protein
MRRAAALLCFTCAFFAFGPVARAQQVDRDCSDFTYQEDAQEYFDSNGGSSSNNFDGLDRDHDGVACEDLPHRPAGTTVSPTPEPTAGGAGVVATPTPTSGSLPNNGIYTDVLGLSGLTAIEIGFALMLLAGWLMRRRRPIGVQTVAAGVTTRPPLYAVLPTFAKRRGPT